MSSQELTKKCPYDGCDYISKASSTHALEHNVSTHVSNSHRGTTTVWFGGTKVTIHRDVKSNSFACPCGEFSHSNAESVRRHARNLHKKMTTARSAARAPKPAIPSEPKAGDDAMYRVVDPNPKDKLHIGGGEVWVPTGPTVVHKAYPLVAMTPMGPPVANTSFYARASTFSSSLCKSFSPVSESIASTSAFPAQPLPTLVSAAGQSTSRSVPSKRKVEEPIPGPSKIRRVDATLSASVSKASASSSKTVGRASMLKPPFTSAPLKLKTSVAISSGFASTSKKRPADDGLPEPSSSKVQRVSGWSTIAERKAAKLAKSPQSVAPLKAPKTVARKVAITKTRPAGNAPPTSTTPSTATASTPAKGPPKPRPIVKPGTLVQAQAKLQAASPSKAEPKKHVRPAPAAGVAASSASSGFSTSTRGSSPSSSARTSATPASDRDRAGPSSAPGPPSVKSRNCSDCGGPIDAYGKNGMCTMCYCESLPDAPPAAPVRCVTCGDKLPGTGTGTAKGGECTTCQLKALPPPHASTSTSIARDGRAAKDAAAKTNAGQQQPKPRKKRVTRQMRQREFERWFARWTAVHRARRASCATKPSRPGAAFEEEADEGEDGDKTDWWRVKTTRNQGGVCYATPEAFFAALEGAFARQKVEGEGEGTGKEKGKGKDKGKGKQKQKCGVLTFYGGYSIVAQPKISAIARLEKLVARMEEIGFRLDSAQQGHVKFKYKSGAGVLDEVFKYPCSCGGAPPPVAEDEMRHAHRLPDEKHAGEVCGGTIMLMVGEDNALLAYGIQGQRIAVDIVH